MPEQLTPKQVELDPGSYCRARTARRQRTGGADPTKSRARRRGAGDVPSGVATGACRVARRRARSRGRAHARRPGFGGRFIEARRFVPGDAATVRIAVDRFLKEQCFQLKRNLGHAQIWEAAHDWWTRMRRAFRPGAYRLPRDVEIEVRVTDVPEVRTACSSRCASMRPRTDAASWCGGGIRDRRCGGGRWGSVAAPHAARGTRDWSRKHRGSWRHVASRSSFRNERERLSVALERFLDFLEHEPTTTQPIAAGPNQAARSNSCPATGGASNVSPRGGHRREARRVLVRIADRLARCVRIDGERGGRAHPARSPHRTRRCWRTRSRTR